MKIHDIYRGKKITTEVRRAHCAKCASHIERGGVPGSKGDCILRGAFHGVPQLVWQESTLSKFLSKRLAFVRELTSGAHFRASVARLGTLNPFGTFAYSAQFHNVISNVGHAAANGRISNQGGYSPFVNQAIGIGSETAAAADKALSYEITSGGGQRAAGTASQVTTTITNDTMQLVHTWSFTASFGVTEEGIFDATSAPTVTTLTASINNSVTSATVASGSGITNNDFAQIDNEIVQITAGGGTSTLTIARGQSGTSGASHANGAGLTDFTAGGGNMLAKQTFSVVNVNNGDSLQVTHKVQT